MQRTPEVRPLELALTPCLQVSEMPSQERPAERLKRFGARALTTAELLTVATRSTSTNTAELMLAACRGSLTRLSQSPRATLADFPGMSDAKALALVAALEIGRRMNAETVSEAKPLRKPRDVFTLMSPQLAHLDHEEFWCLMLDGQHKVKAPVRIAVGTLNTCVVHPREVFAEAISERAAAVVLVHNHPSGDPTPSPDDHAVTDQMVSAGKILGIPVHDHVIIGSGRYVSFAESGLLTR